MSDGYEELEARYQKLEEDYEALWQAARDFLEAEDSCKDTITLPYRMAQEVFANYSDSKYKLRKLLK